MRKYAILDVNGPVVEESRARRDMGQYVRDNYRDIFSDDPGMQDYMAHMLKMEPEKRVRDRRYMQGAGKVMKSGFRTGRLQLAKYPAADTAFHKMRNRGVGVVLFSDMPGAEYADKVLGWSGQVHECLGPSFGSKKDPATWRKVMGRYGDAEVRFFSDDGMEVSAAESAGVTSVQVANGNELLNALHGWID